MRSDPDVAIIGGGPTGAVAALALARSGVRTMLFEMASVFPFRIGESLIPRVYDLLHGLGIGDRVDRVPHVPKYGAAFAFAHEETLRRIRFGDAFPGSATRAWNVERAPFNEMLLDAAAEAGAEVSRGGVVRTIEHLSDGDVRIATDGGPIRARYLIDASGRATVLGHHLRIREPMKRHRRAAYYGHFEGVERDSGQQAGDVLGYMFAEGWIWIIPIDATRTSIGAVLNAEVPKRTGVPPEEILGWAIARSPEVARRCANAMPTGTTGAAADFSYRCRPFAGPGYLIAGDAAAFFDPIFSTGVCLGITSALLAAEALRSIFRHGADPATARNHYAAEIDATSTLFFRLIDVFYDHAFRELFLHPRPILQLDRAFVSFLTGSVTGSSIPKGLKWRLRVTELLTIAQRYVPLAPRRTSWSLLTKAPVPGPRGRSV